MFKFKYLICGRSPRNWMPEKHPNTLKMTNQLKCPSITAPVANDTYFCQICNRFCNSELNLRINCSSKRNKRNVNTDNEIQKVFRRPPPNVRSRRHELYPKSVCVIIRHWLTHSCTHARTHARTQSSTRSIYALQHLHTQFKQSLIHSLPPNHIPNNPLVRPSVRPPVRSSG